MAETLTISPANLRALENGISVINANLKVVNGNIDVVNNQVNRVDTKLESLYVEFNLFLEADRKAKQLQLAETRIVKIRQELDKKFGVHDEVRRHSTGILQASDLSMVRTETILTRAEELMLNAPRYWLAPCLIALAAWMADNKPLAEKAIQEAIKRDSEKSTLFFSLVCRRSGRLDACNQWLSRYLSLQDPTSLDREVIILLDAFASGLLGPDTKGECSKSIMSWIQELSKQPHFIEEQKQKWETGLRSILSRDLHTNYPRLKQYSKNFDELISALDAAKSHGVYKSHFSDIMDSDLKLDSSLVVEIDVILDKLTQEFDDEELPLRRDELRLSLIIDHEGDTAEADQKFSEQQSSLQEKVNFTQLLTNAAMHPEISHASKATQKLAIALSLEWILMAYKDMTARYQAAVPDKINLELVAWQGASRDGKNEAELVQSLTEKIETDKKNTLAKIKTNVGALVMQIIMIGLVVVSQSTFVLVLAAGGVIWLLVSMDGLNKKKKAVAEQYRILLVESIAILKACLAEVVDFRTEFQKMDNVYKPTLDYLSAIDPQQYITNSFSKARSIL